MFRILIEPVSSTHCYLLACDRTGEAVLIDPVLQETPRYEALLREASLSLRWVLDTHLHADHVTAAAPLSQAHGARCAIGPAPEATGYDLQLSDGDAITFGEETLHVIATPGHTACSVCYLWGQRLFTGDTLLVGGCGRTDLQGGCPAQLYASVTERLFTLPDHTEVWPGHDYQGRLCSTIGQERRSNARLAGRSRTDFVELMHRLGLPAPRLIDLALPRNRLAGLAQGQWVAS